MAIARNSSGNSQRLAVKTVSGDSMRPILRSGQRVMIDELSDPGSLRKGDVLALGSDKDALVFHRFITRGEDGSLITRGDYAHQKDKPWQPDQLAGVLVAIAQAATGKRRSAK